MGLVINQKISVIFDDGKAISQHIGFFKDKDTEFLYLETKGTTEAIPISKIIRVEVIRGGTL